MGITYPSGHATDAVGFSAPVIAESLRDAAHTSLDSVYINLDSPQSMVEDHKKNESESESEWKALTSKSVNTNFRHIMWLEKRILALESALMSFTYNSEMGSGHPDDGGWFD